MSTNGPNMTRPGGGLDVRSPDAPQGIAIPGIPAGPATNLNEQGGVVSVRSHARRGRPVKAHVRLLKRTRRK